MSPSFPRIASASRLALLRARKQRMALAVYFFTGNYSVPSHPLLRRSRLAWSSTAVPGTLLANS